jgi:hypothetical protein
MSSFMLSMSRPRRDEFWCENSSSDEQLSSYQGPDILETEEEEGEMIPPQRMFDRDSPADQDSGPSERHLSLQAAEDLRKIPDQFRLNTTEIN